jgi:Fic family protein
MNDKLKLLSERKKELDALLPFAPELQKNLDEWFKVELTYSSNAIEGNTLSRIETAEVIERGVTAVISGKPVKDILEARNHANALDFIKELAEKRKGHQFITEEDIKAVHKFILEGIDDKWAGVYRQTDVFIRGANTEFPRPNAVPYAMQEFINWLQGIQDEHPVRIASDAHFKLVSIHPFIDGNGRTSRLLMNLILLMHGYPMAVIRNEDRTAYLATFNEAREKNNMKPFYTIVEEAVERSLTAYINAGQGKSIMSDLSPALAGGKLLKIGELAKATKETIHTLRFWTKEGLLQVKEYTDGGYQLYEPKMIEQAKEIRRLQEVERRTLTEIKELFTK